LDITKKKELFDALMGLDNDLIEELSKLIEPKERDDILNNSLYKMFRKYLGIIIKIAGLEQLLSDFIKIPVKELSIHQWYEDWYKEEYGE